MASQVSWPKQRQQPCRSGVGRGSSTHDELTIYCVNNREEITSFTSNVGSNQIVKYVSVVQEVMGR